MANIASPFIDYRSVEDTESWNAGNSVHCIAPRPSLIIDPLRILKGLHDADLVRVAIALH